MGVVFRAHDERLDRDVAIKLLPLGTIHDDAARKQLRKEALIVSKLNHPNIATIYDFDSQDGLDFLVMELIPGSTLDERLASGALSEKEALRLAAQLVEGLSAAHARGVVHQDLKPSNLRITPDHRLKILDFGLARLFLPPSPTGDTESLQKSQAAKGTLPYMAPEQLLGESVDQRTDIHGAGAVLYEMVTGQRPFKETQSSRLIDSILHHEPVFPRSINPQISAELERIILKCLEKSPDDRYQAARELEVDLRRLGTSSSGHKLASDTGSRNTDPSRFRRNRKYLAIAAPLILAAIAAAAFFLFRSAPVTQEATVVPLTTLPGQEISPSFSPDGTQVAFGWDGENNGAGFDVYVKAVGADKPLRITNHPAAWLGVAWSPDGRYVAVSRPAGEYSGVFLVPPTGGPERKLLSNDVLAGYGTGVSWSPDSQQLAFVVHLQDSPIDVMRTSILPIDSPSPKLLDTDCARGMAPVFSPQGDALAYICIEDFGQFGIRVLNLADQTTRRVFSAHGFIDGLAWSADGKRIVYSFNLPGGASDLWQIDLSHLHQPEKLSFGRDGSTPTINFISKRLAYAQQSQNVNIWRLQLDLKHPRATPLVTSTREQNLPNISPDGRKVAFGSTRSGYTEIWVCEADGTNAVQLTFLKSLTGTPRWSPDGKQILFDSRAGGEANLYLIGANGGAPRKLETGTRSNSLGAWSNDGRWIYYENGSDSRAPSIWRIPASGGTATPIAKAPSTYPIASPDGKYVYFVRDVGGQTRLWQVQPDGSRETVVLGMPALRFVDEWWPVRNGIYFIGDIGSKQAIEFLDLQTSKIRQVYTLEKSPEPWTSALAVSPDGTRILYSQIDEIGSDLMLVENFH